MSARTPGIDDWRVSASSLRERIEQVVNDNIEFVTIFPALLVIFLVFVVPLISLLRQSVYITLPGVPPRFVGIENFVRVFTSDNFWIIFQHTLMYSGGSLLLTLILGFSAALAINKITHPRLRTVYVVLILLGWAIPGVVAALTWKWIFSGAEFGLFNMLLMDAGIIDSSVGWLGDQTFAKIAVIIVDAWVRIPFAMIVFLAGLQSIPDHMYEAVEIDGGTVFTKFRHVTLPYLRPYFGLVILITWMFAFRAFAFVFTITGGGPGQATRVLAIEIHNVGIRLGDYGYAAALSLFLVLITLILGAVYITVFLRGVDE